MPIALNPKHLTIVQDILKNHPGCYVFGSRAKGNPKQFSDLDLCFIRDKALPVSELSALEEAFEESDLPYTVDIVDYQKTAPSFREIIDNHKIPFPYLP